MVTPVLHAAPGGVAPLDLGIPSGSVYATVVQPDGKMIIAGNFSSVLGVPRHCIARLNADGSLDLDFDPNADRIVYSIVVQADGKILLGGEFTTVGGSPRNYIARVDANGSLDPSFDPNANGRVYSMALQEDGKIVLGGVFTSVGGVVRNRIARVDASGALDMVFDPNANSWVQSVVVQPDGKILLGGWFTSMGGMPRNFIARVTASGELDSSFNPWLNWTVRCMVLQPDGKILIGGNFDRVENTHFSYVARLDAEGVLDLGFNPNVSTTGLSTVVTSMVLQADGKILLGGWFTSVGGMTRNRIARVDASGVLDAGFNPNAEGGNVWSVAVQADGRIQLGGTFTTVGGVERNLFAELYNDPATQILSVPHTARVEWARGGAVPEVSRVTFELSTDGGVSWSTLGAGKRISGGWEITGLNLPSSGRIRARGRTSEGGSNGSSSLIEQVAVFADLLGPPPVVAVSLANLPSNATTLTIIGENFDAVTPGNNTVVFVPSGTGIVTAATATSLTVTGISGLVPGPLSAVVTTNGQNSGAAVQVGTVVGPPTVVMSAADLASNATTLTITGENFDAMTPGNNTVVFTPSGAGMVTAATATSLTVTGVSGLTLGSLSAVVTTNGQDSGAAVQVGTVVGPPTVVMSAADLASNATTLTITGENFDAMTPGNNTVVFTPSGAGMVTAATATSLTVTGVSGLTLGSLSAVVTTNGQNSGAAVQVGTAVGPPTVVMSAAELDSNATTLTITGENFDAVTPGNNTLVFVPTGTGTVTAATAISLTVTAISGLTPGPLSAVVTTNGQDSGAAVQVATVITLPGNLAPPDLGISNGTVYTTVVQPDGKTIIAGTFTSVLGVLRSRIARLNVDGTLDMEFDPSANSAIYSVAMQADGKILLGGAFTSVGGVTRNRIARVDVSGALDYSFDPNANQLVYSVAVQADNRILLSGAFNRVGGATRTGIARITASGVLDTGFSSSANGAISSLAVQSDGRILLGGNFTSVGGVTRNRIARLNATGDVDASFDPNANGVVYAMAVQPDGQILIGGDFTSIGGTPRNRLARVAASGTVDSLFDASVDTAVRSVAVQANGQILLGGQFTSVGGVNRNRIARIGANGVLDPGFDPNADGGTVYSVAVQADGRVLLGGTFTAVGGVARNCFASLYNDPSTQMLSVPDTSRVAWSRGGAGPEVEQVTFELSTDGGASWTPLGAGTHVTGGWEKTGLSLPADGSVRARGRTNCGNSNGSSGLIEQMANFSGVPSTSSEIAVEQPAFTGLSSGVNVSFGAVTPSSSSVAKTFTIKNTGSAQLTITSVGTTGGHADDFIVSTTGMLTSLPATVGSTTFAVTFTPSALGSRTTTLRIVNDDGDENPFDLTLSGTGVTIVDAWALDHGVSNDLSLLGVNGQANLLNFAFGLDPTVAALPALMHTGTFSGGGTIASYGQPVTAFEFNGGETEFRVLFVRRKDYLAAGLDYTPRFSGDLSFWQDGVDTPTVLADDGIYQVVSVPFPLSVDGKPGRFAVIRVSLVP